MAAFRKVYASPCPLPRGSWLTCSGGLGPLITGLSPSPSAPNPPIWNPRNRLNLTLRPRLLGVRLSPRLDGLQAISQPRRPSGRRSRSLSSPGRAWAWRMQLVDSRASTWALRSASYASLRTRRPSVAVATVAVVTTRQGRNATNRDGSADR